MQTLEGITVSGTFTAPWKVNIKSLFSIRDLVFINPVSERADCTVNESLGIAIACTSREIFVIWEHNNCDRRLIRVLKMQALEFSCMMITFFFFLIIAKKDSEMLL